MHKDNGASSGEDRATHEPSPTVSAVPVGIPSADTIGFTGTQKGCERPQLVTLRGWLGTLCCAGFQWMRNGDCVGADAEAARTWEALGLKLCLHPPIVKAKRAFLRHDEACRPLPYLERNEDIVDASGVMVATPAEMVEQRRGGTWYTIRYARRRKKPLCIIWPDGSWVSENGFAQAIETRRAETGTGSVHESAVAESEAPNV